jgi:short-subunit dehydrogenase involved in D-alanine esterification of teichoic acids
MSYHYLKYGNRFIKGTHGLLFTLGALGIGYVLGKTMKPKNKKTKMVPILGRTRKCIKDIKQGWYGIVDEAKGNLDQSGTAKSNNEVKVNRQEISGYKTENISRA